MHSLTVRWMMVGAALAMIGGLAAGADTKYPRPDSSAVEQDVTRLLDKLTLEQKIDLLGGLTFDFGHFGVLPDTVSDGESVTVSFDVRNTGLRTGAEVRCRTLLQMVS